MSTESVPVILGRLLALTAEINEKLSRSISRAEALEVRVETLEKAEAVRAASLSAKVAEKAVYAVLGAVGVMALKMLGLI